MVLEVSRDVVSREIDGDVIIVPLVAGLGEDDDELYTLNETGQAIWGLFDGQRTLAEITALMLDRYDATRAEVEADVLGFATTMRDRGFLQTPD